MAATKKVHGYYYDGYSDVDRVFLDEQGVLWRKDESSSTRVNDPIALVVPNVAKTSAYTLTDDDGTVFADASGGAFDLTAPTAVGRKGRRFTVVRVNGGGNAATLKSAGGTISGVAAATGVALSAQWMARTIESDGTNWIIVAGYL